MNCHIAESSRSARGKSGARKRSGGSSFRHVGPCLRRRFSQKIDAQASALVSTCRVNLERLDKGFANDARIMYLCRKPGRSFVRSLVSFAGQAGLRALPFSRQMSAGRRARARSSAELSACCQAVAPKAADPPPCRTRQHQGPDPNRRAYGRKIRPDQSRAGRSWLRYLPPLGASLALVSSGPACRLNRPLLRTWGQRTPSPCLSYPCSVDISRFPLYRQDNRRAGQGNGIAVPIGMC